MSDQSPYDAGRAAWEDGGSNPHTTGTRECDEWDKGLADADCNDEDDEDCNDDYDDEWYDEDDEW